MTVHTVITRIAAAGEQPDYIPEARDGSLANAIRRVIMHLDNTISEAAARLTVFVHIWSDALPSRPDEHYRFIGDPADCRRDLHDKWPTIVDKYDSNNDNNGAANTENNAKEMRASHSFIGDNALDWVAT